MPLSSSFVQILVALQVNLLALSMGANMGWASYGIYFLSSSESDLETGRLTDYQVGLTNSMYSVGGLIGSLTYGFICDKIGRKQAIRTLAVPQIISYLLIVFAKTSSMIMISRVFAGLSAGGLYIVVPIFVSEISGDEIRGTVGTLFIMMSASGMLLSYTLGSFMQYNTCVFVFMAFPILHLVGSFFIHETPFYFIKTGRPEEAENAFLFYRRGTVESAREEFKGLKEFLTKRIAVERVSFADFKTKHAKKSIIIGIFMVWMEQFCGCFSALFYFDSTFEASGTSMSPEVATILIGAIQLCGAYISTFLVDRSGRKILICCAAFGVCLGHIVFGVATQLIEHGHTNEFIKLLPVIGLAFSIFLANIGTFTMTFVVISEIVPSNLKSYIFTLCMGLSWTFMFIVFTLRVHTVELLGLGGMMYAFALNAICGGIFTIFYIPETMAKSFEEISKMME